MKTVFIAGVQRSGTTLLSVMLSKHPEVDIDGNSIAFRLVSCFKYYKDVLPYNLSHNKEEILSWLIKKDYKGRLMDILDYKNLNKYPDAQSIISQGISKRLKDNKKIIFGDKSPNIEFFASDLMMLIPNAKFIHIVRDGRAAASSRSKRAHKNLSLSAQEWIDGNIQGLANQALIGPKQYKIIKFEDLVNDPKEVAEELCLFLDIPFNSRMIEKSKGVKDENSYVKPDFDSTKIDAFRQHLTPQEINKIEKIQGPLLNKFGYKLDYPLNKGSYKQLSIAQRIWLNQLDNFSQLFISKRMGMVNRKNVEVKISLDTRLKTFIFEIGKDFLPDKVFKRVFRKRWIGDVYFNGSEVNN